MTIYSDCNIEGKIIFGNIELKSGTLTLARGAAVQGKVVVKPDDSKADEKPNLVIKSAVVAAVTVENSGDVTVGKSSVIKSLSVLKSGNVKVSGEVAGGVSVESSKEVTISGQIGGPLSLTKNKAGIKTCGATLLGGVTVDGH